MFLTEGRFMPAYQKRYSGESILSLLTDLEETVADYSDWILLTKLAESQAGNVTQGIRFL